MKNVVTGWSKGLFQVTFAVIVGVLFSVVAVNAATTISTVIQTDGTLSVTGLSTFLGGATTTTLTLLNGAVISEATDGVVQINATASTTGITLLNGEAITNTTDGVIQLGGIASSTSITLLNGETITNAVDGTIALTGAATISSTLSVTSLATLLGGATTTTLTLLNGEVISNATDGVIQMNGIASSTSITLLNGETITNAVDGTIAVTATNVTFSGAASSTTLRVGDDQISTIAGMIFGYCNIATVTVTATSTAYRDCTGATGVTSSYRVFVQATSSLPAGLHITAASSTATAGTLNVRIQNSTAGADTATGGISFNFWAVR